MKTGLLLCTYNVEQRRDMYHTIIRWWMKNSKFDIYIVDSSNNEFDKDIEESCKTFHFDQYDVRYGGDDMKCSSTLTEVLSLREVHKVFGEEWENNYDYIIKLTCKYTLPELEKQCNAIKNRDNIMLIQNRGGANTELLIIRSDKFGELVEEFYKMDSILEHRLRDLKPNFKHIKLPKIYNTSTYKRAAGDTLHWL